MIEVSTAAAVAGTVMALLAQASALAFFLGKQSQRIDSEKELNELRFTNVSEANDRILEATKDNTRALEGVQDCMHKMQAGKEC